MKAIYPDIDFAHLRQVKLKKDLSGYVSYRWGETIYWTSMEVTLRVGEIVFTDGVRLVRGRCLNDYSPIPMLPIRPDEPSEQVLDTPVEIPLIAYSFRAPSPEALTPAVPISPPRPASASGFRWSRLFRPSGEAAELVHRETPAGRDQSGGTIIQDQRGTSLLRWGQVGPAINGGFAPGARAMNSAESRFFRSPNRGALRDQLGFLDRGPARTRMVTISMARSGFE